ncbi:ATP-binding protein [Amycolatopsis cihanbeyliensis]|uniref:Tetratricopeptide (TPR) repeat protein n=1 Tax=Amycolatopsis cihanbeyliensis TaxID=1128664 RepID=A0A542DQB4_AMYCI|nr:tetratricopeptide repeat protein [Amycolatopsis cihanbeyliensis]TQJ05301.1 tetratricopeptide (TPR) repeat protein [Amycolatopsis cihanbeyliensis]
MDSTETSCAAGDDIPERAPEVFVSYAHDSATHKEQVLEFSGLLTRHGIEVRLDQWAGHGRRDWYTWAMRCITQSDFVVVVASPRYREAGDGLAAADQHRGVQTEAALLRDLLHANRPVWMPRILPMVLPGRSVEDIPLFLQPHCADHYRISELTAPGVAELVDVLRAGPVPPGPALGRGRVLPPNSSSAPALRTTAARMATLPRDISSFTGREGELGELVDAVDADRRRAGGLPIYAVEGMPGVGKTAFAVHLAHLLADRFPDGQLFLELHGHTPAKAPLDPLAALGSLLLALGVAAQQIPTRLEDRVQMWRDRLTGKRVLLLLDDVAGYEQLRPLFPGAGECLVLVTSRRRLTAPEDIRSLSLGVLSPGEAAEMLLRLARTGASRHEPDAVTELVRLCGCLPLAVALTAGRLRSHPCWTVRYLIGQLCTAQDRLAGLHTEDLAVAAAFDLSYRDLAPDERRLFRRLGLYPGDEMDVYAAAALDGSDLDTAGRRLEALYLHHLLEEAAPGRYRLHDLIRDYAGTLAAKEPAAERRWAVDRLLDYYLHTTIVAAARVPRCAAVVYPMTTAPTDHAPDLSSEGLALEWLMAERLSLSRCVEYAADNSRFRHAIRLAVTLHSFLLLHGHWDHAVTVHRAALRAARASGDRIGEAATLNNLGYMQYMTNDLTAAAESLRAAHGLFAEADERLGVANVLTDLGRLEHITRNYPAAVANLRRAHRLHHDLGDTLGEANTLNALGAVLYETGNYRASMVSHRRAHVLYADSGNTFGQARSINSMAALEMASSRYTEATRNFHHAHDLAVALGDSLGEAKALNNLGIVQGTTGKYAAALATLTRARALYARLGEQYGEANTLIHIGRAHHLAGRYDEAAESLLLATRMFQRLGDERGMAKALTAQGRLRHTGGDYRSAWSDLSRARAIYERFGDTHGEARAVTALGALRCTLGDFNGAFEDLTLSHAHFSVVSDREGQAETLNNLGVLGFCWPYAGDPETHYTHALELARESSVPLEQGRALEGIGRCRARNSDSGEAIDHLCQALTLYRRLRVPEAEQVEAVLRTMGPPGRRGGTGEAGTSAPKPRRKPFDGRT